MFDEYATLYVCFCVLKILFYERFYYEQIKNNYCPSYLTRYHDKWFLKNYYVYVRKDEFGSLLPSKVKAIIKYASWY